MTATSTLDDVMAIAIKHDERRTATPCQIVSEWIIWQGQPAQIRTTQRDVSILFTSGCVAANWTRE
jgi:hypothetical protein